jgi:hypothetical protein
MAGTANPLQIDDAMGLRVRKATAEEIMVNG